MTLVDGRACAARLLGLDDGSLLLRIDGGLPTVDADPPTGFQVSELGCQKSEGEIRHCPGVLRGRPRTSTILEADVVLTNDSGSTAPLLLGSEKVESPVGRLG